MDKLSGVKNSCLNCWTPNTKPSASIHRYPVIFDTQLRFHTGAGAADVCLHVFQNLGMSSVFFTKILPWTPNEDRLMRRSKKIHSICLLVG